MKEPMNTKQRIVIIAMDLLLLAELAIAIYLGHRQPDNLTLVFLRTYIPAMLVTVILARICFVRLRSAEGVQSCS
jgi:hypothetical protein